MLTVRDSFIRRANVSDGFSFPFMATEGTGKYKYVKVTTLFKNEETEYCQTNMLSYYTTPNIYTSRDSAGHWEIQDNS